MKRLLLLITFFTLMTHLEAQKTIPLYEGEIPNSKPTTDKEDSATEGGIFRISNISKPTLAIYLPDKAKATGTAVVICPGGGYWINAYKHEGTDVAAEFVKMGVAAFVLKYRIPNDATMQNKEIGPLQDAQQAIKYVRQHAKAYNLDANRIGIMGFSAGGHLASTAGTHFNHAYIDNKENISLRPNFMMLIYPVISFQDSIGHIGSRDQLIGKNPSEEKKREYSNELQVSDSTPPTFLVHATDDNGVKVQNSIEFYLALLAHKVPAEMHIYQTGGHGFGLHIKNDKDLWMERCKNWMDLNGWLK